MTTINSIARTETEENLNDAVESLNIDKVQDLLLRFDFNEEFLKDLTLHIMQEIDLENNILNVATLLLKNTSKQIKEEVFTELRQRGVFGAVSAIQLYERLDL